MRLKHRKKKKLFKKTTPDSQTIRVRITRNDWDAFFFVEKRIKKETNNEKNKN